MNLRREMKKQEDKLIKYLKEIGCTEASKKTGLKKQYLSSCSTGRIKMSHAQVLNLIEKLKI
jgi:hypothetical protein